VRHGERRDYFQSPKNFKSRSLTIEIDSRKMEELRRVTIETQLEEARLHRLLKINIPNGLRLIGLPLLLPILANVR